MKTSVKRIAGIPFKSLLRKAVPGSFGASSKKLCWHRSLLGKVTLCLLTGVVVSYVAGTAAGWVVVEQSSREQWLRQARMNAQIASAAIRTVYTFVVADTDPSGQMVQIISERPLGDDDSILDTGFNPADVLAVAAAQTGHDVWLLQFRKDINAFVSIADGNGAASGLRLHILDADEISREGDAGFFTGFARIGEAEHFVSFLPVNTQSGEKLGAIVASIGTREDLYRTRDELVRNSLLILVGVLLITGVFIALVMRKTFHPVPALIQALTRIARDDTGNVTPFLTRKDEIGHLAVAIETLREAVVEREHLRQVKETAVQMEHLARHDTLTGLPNRAYFNARLDKALAGLVIDGSGINIMLIDLDRFKAVNDTFGHATGDALLVQATERITALLGPEDIAARLGGDEFAIIQKVTEDAAPEAGRLARKIVAATSRPFHINGCELNVGASIGISCAPLHGNAADILLTNADIALYAAKDAGRGNYHFFRDGMAMASAHRYALEKDIAAALEREEFELHYQRIVNLSSMETVGYEALLRWRHPQQGLVPPDRFIPIAEETGLIVKIGEWVIRRACEDAVRWPGNLTVAVNISAVQVNREGLATTIQKALNDSGLDPKRLEIEVTETAMLSLEHAISVLTAIRATGAGIALDDFGTGYATLSYLSELPLTRVKIDRSFVAGMADRAECRAIVAGVTSLAHALGMETTAEGVETAKQLEILAMSGCRYAQGYYLGRPEPVVKIEENMTRMPSRLAGILLPI